MTEIQTEQKHEKTIEDDFNDDNWVEHEKALNWLKTPVTIKYHRCVITEQTVPVSQCGGDDMN